MFRKSASQAAVFIYTCPQDHPFVFNRYALRVTGRFGHGQPTAMPRPPHYWQCRWHLDVSAEAEPASFNNKVIAGGKPVGGVSSRFRRHLPRRSSPSLRRRSSSCRRRGCSPTDCRSSRGQHPSTFPSRRGRNNSRPSGRQHAVTTQHPACLIIGCTRVDRQLLNQAVARRIGEQAIFAPWNQIIGLSPCHKPTTIT